MRSQATTLGYFYLATSGTSTRPLTRVTSMFTLVFLGAAAWSVHAKMEPALWAFAAIFALNTTRSGAVCGIGLGFWGVASRLVWVLRWCGGGSGGGGWT